MLSKFGGGGDKKIEKKWVLGEKLESMNYKGLDSFDPDWRRFVRVEGIHIHYYSYHISEPEVVIPFLEDFLSKILRALKKEKRIEAAKYAGSLLHCLQDAASPAHSAEEHLLRSFAPPPTFWQNKSLHSAVEIGRKVSLRDFDCRPKLLGTDVKQTIFHGFYEIYEMHRKALGAAVPILIAIYGGKQRKANDLFSRACRACVPVCADLLHTLYLLAQNRFSPKDKKCLNECDLRLLRPITIEQDQNYYDYTLDFSRDISHSFRPTPFKLLIMENGKIKEKRFKYGIGTMTDAGVRTKDYHTKLVYYLYPGVYERFQTLVGLHYGLVGNAMVKIQVFTDSKEVFSSTFTEKDPACKIDIPIKGTKELTLFAGPSDSTPSPSFIGNKSIIWANPKLIK